MKKIIIPLLLITGMFIQAYGQKTYYIKKIGNIGEFIYPPHSKLKLNSEGTQVKKNFRYQYIYLDSLNMTNGDYYSVINLLNKGKYFTSWDSIETICFDTECYGCRYRPQSSKKQSYSSSKRKPKPEIKKRIEAEFDRMLKSTNKNEWSKICDLKVETIGRFCKIKYSYYDQKAFLLQIDYGKIFSLTTESEKLKLEKECKDKIDVLKLQTNKADQKSIDITNIRIDELTQELNYDISHKGIIENRFFEIAKDLIEEFSSHENNQIEDFDWPTTISQNIVEKIFELLPIPSESSLSRYIAQIDISKSFVLLSPKIKLKVDAVEKVKEGANWYFNLLGTSIVTINRSNNGKIIQNPFREFQVKGMPNNLVIDKTILQSSTEDIQLSESLRECQFVFLWQNNFKQNNKNSQPGGCVDSETDLINCNSQLWHFDKLWSFYTSDGLGDLDYDSVKYISSFGYRNLITPIIDITVNGNLIQYPLGSNLNQLRNQMAIPSASKIYRFWKGEYVKINIKNIDNLILLPNDKIIY